MMGVSGALVVARVWQEIGGSILLGDPKVGWLMMLVYIG